MARRRQLLRRERDPVAYRLMSGFGAAVGEAAILMGQELPRGRRGVRIRPKYIDLLVTEEAKQRSDRK